MLEKVIVGAACFMLGAIASQQVYERTIIQPFSDRIDEVENAELSCLVRLSDARSDVLSCEETLMDAKSCEQRLKTCIGVRQ